MVTPGTLYVSAMKSPIVTMQVLIVLLLAMLGLAQDDLDQCAVGIPERLFQIIGCFTDLVKAFLRIQCGIPKL